MKKIVLAVALLFISPLSSYATKMDLFLEIEHPGIRNKGFSLVTHGQGRKSLTMCQSYNSLPEEDFPGGKFCSKNPSFKIDTSPDFSKKFCLSIEAQYPGTTVRDSFKDTFYIPDNVSSMKIKLARKDGTGAYEFTVSILKVIEKVTAEAATETKEEKKSEA
jgi:hypothetical protein